MSEEDIRRMIEEATKEAMKQSFTDAAQKFLQAAKASEQKGDFAGAENLQRQAGENFWKAANEYRAAKSFKAAAINMCMAGDAYSDLGNAENALKAYEQGANDLYGASSEHLMWGEDAETKKGTALAVTGAMLLLMIGKDADAFSRARKFAAENASRLRFPGVVRLSQIPQMLESAINAMDLTAFADAETAAVTELKAALAGANAQEFSTYVDKGVEMVREMLRGKLKVPKISSQLELPVDMTFKEQFLIRAIIVNTGDGAAKDVKVEWHIDEGLEMLSGSAAISTAILAAGETWSIDLEAKAKEDLMGSKEYEILLRGVYSDDLRTEYSLQAGPASFVLKDYKETEKLLQDVDVTEGRVSLLYPQVDASSLEGEPLMRVLASLESSLATAREEISLKELNSAKARISIVNALVDTVDTLIGDEALQADLEKSRVQAKKDYAKGMLASLETDLASIFDGQISKIEGESSEAFSKWDNKIEGKKRLKQSISNVKDKVSDVIREIESAYAKIPAAGGTDNPEIASLRTQSRTSLESLKSKVIELRYDLESIAADSAIEPDERPVEHPKIKMAKNTVESIRTEVKRILDEKSS